jgi:hypothetical protein
MTKQCIDCGKSPTVERKRCKECALLYNRQRIKKYYSKEKRNNYFLKKYGKSYCSVCGEPLIKTRENQMVHEECLKGLSVTKSNYSDHNPYSNLSGVTKARKIFIEYYGKEKMMGYVVHHLDGDVENNNPINLLALSPKYHGRLHAHLRRKRSLWLKNHNSNVENCWKPLMVQLTTTWLEITNVNVLKITEIGKSAAELANCNKSQEGSETMYDNPKS